VAFNLELALDPRAKLASPARKENEGRDENRLSKAQIEGIAELISDFFNSIGHHLKGHSVSVLEYKIRYGLPFDRGLTCETTRQLKSEAITPEMRLKASKNAARVGGLRCELSRRACRHFLSGFSVGIFVESGPNVIPKGFVRSVDVSIQPVSSHTRHGQLAPNG
jgi:hypothetical protein